MQLVVCWLWISTTNTNCVFLLQKVNIDFWNNNLSRLIPENLGCCKSLRLIKQANNHLSSSVPIRLFNLPCAWILDMLNKHLTGQLVDLDAGVEFLPLHLTNNFFSTSWRVVSPDEVFHQGFDVADRKAESHRVQYQHQLPNGNHPVRAYRLH